MFGGTGERLSLPKNLFRGDGVLEDSLLAGRGIRRNKAKVIRARFCWNLQDRQDEKDLPGWGASAGDPNGRD